MNKSKTEELCNKNSQSRQEKKNKKINITQESPTFDSLF